jgi:hypothetical protein
METNRWIDFDQYIDVTFLGLAADHLDFSLIWLTETPQRYTA